MTGQSVRNSPRHTLCPSLIDLHPLLGEDLAQLGVLHQAVCQFGELDGEILLEGGLHLVQQHHRVLVDGVVADLLQRRVPVEQIGQVEAGFVELEPQVDRPEASQLLAADVLAEVFQLQDRLGVVYNCKKKKRRGGEDD